MNGMQPKALREKEVILLFLSSAEWLCEKREERKRGRWLPIRTPTLQEPRSSRKDLPWIQGRRLDPSAVPRLVPSPKKYAKCAKYAKYVKNNV